MATESELPPDARALLVPLMRELFQAETSAARHCAREAERLGDTSPAHALRAVATHAQEVLRALPELARAHGLPASSGASALGELLSQGRDKVADALMDSERSYRGTLLGCRHGVDVALLMCRVTTETRDLGLADFLDGWLATRRVLVQNMEDALQWFAKHPLHARRMARAPFPFPRRTSVA